MKISDKKVVALIYELNVNGEIVDKTTKERPLEFIQGMGYLLPLFEKNIEGKEPGDKFAFTLEPADGYGVWEEERVIDLPKAAFEVDGKMREDLMVVGNTIPLVNQMGGVVPGKILEIGEDSVKIDINHPMAGKTLDFSGEIVEVRDATEKELTEGLHGEFAQRHECRCGGGCSGECEGGCDGECDGGCKEEGGSCSDGGCEGGCHKKK